jgi:hypothetical protein
MLKDAIQNLRLDRRLAHRRGWVDPEERERALAALPDVAAKGTRGEGEDEEPRPGRPGEPAAIP